ncbi:hypothetical protein [Alkalibacillus silvisoli]|uniref:Thymidylate kinase-like domain-containing protein n=1 Tax=Alkalibacillus silvisoli TaxID=392823 RepID=A0ABP3K4U9_9BACI
MIIELIGLPASGKTTLAKEMYKRLGKNNSVIFPLNSLNEKSWLVRNIYKSISVTLYCITHLRTFFTVISKIHKSRLISFFDNFRLAFNILFVLSLRDKYRKHNKIIIFDEGILHYIWAVSVNSGRKDVYQLFNNVIDEVDLTIRVECPKELNKKRLNSRLNNNQRHSDLMDDFDEVYEVMQNIVNYFIREGHLYKYLSVENIEHTDIIKNSELIIEKFFNDPTAHKGII